MLSRPAVTFGSAHLLVGGMDRATATSLLEAAVAAGASRLDTAPLYGHGGSEALVADVAAASGTPVTTKVGLEPSPPPSAAKAVAGRALRALPQPVEAAARRARRALGASGRAGGSGPGGTPAASGRFEPAAVRASVERSLRALARAGRIDRLLLHEVLPGDVTDGLLAVLVGYQAAGDVRELGVATQNGLTADCLARGAGVLTVAHVSASLGGPAVPAVPAGVHLAGHGLLGAGGADLATARRALRTTRRRRGDDDDALAPALLRLAASVAGVPEVIVATSRTARVAAAVTAPTAPDALGSRLDRAEERAVRQALAPFANTSRGLHAAFEDPPPPP